MGITILIKTVNVIYRVLMIALFARAIMSWITNDYTHPVVNFIYRFTEPLLIPMRKLFDKFNLNRGMIDFSFLASFFAIQIIYKIIMRFLIMLYYR